MKPKLLFMLTLFLHLFFGLYAADHLRISDVRSIAMGGNEATASTLFNPSLLAMSDRHTLRVNCFNRYVLRELGTINGSLYLPNAQLPIGLDVSSFGYDAYRESLFRLLAAKRLSSRWTLGVSVQYALLQTELFEEQPAQLSTDLGLTYAPVDNLLMGLLIMNFPSVSFRNEFTEEMVFMYYLIQAGLQWEVINSLFISAALETSELYAIGGGLGLEYVAFSDFCIRAGIKGAPLLPSFGFGYRFFSFNMDVAAVYHPVLGVSSGIGLAFTF
ncbi:MAG: hypothetical protein LBS05_01265 [Tannerellaceae bacterium]|jgi:hypothetical protein|nr:hypothetical protein [Tannerellaceae bacterium]